MSAPGALAQPVLPQPTPAFAGKIGVSAAESTPEWPQRPTLRKGAPNVVLILLDDVGFAATDGFGGITPTPVIDSLAAGGLRYNRFHVNAMCSPTRAALLSGRNSHGVHFGMIAESAVGYPGYDATWPRSSASIAEVLKLNGYSTAAFGKWHNTPPWDVSQAGPFDRFPTGLGFEYFYGFLSAATSQYEPTLWRNTTPVEPPKAPRDGYHLTTDLVDDATRWVHQHDSIAPDKPFFLYFATGATHVPHHVGPEWVDKFKGKFDAGWDVIRQESFERQKKLGVIPANAELTPRPKEIPAWDTLSPELKKLLSHQMEVYAAFLAQTDYEIGRLLAAIRADGHVEDTAIFYIVGDNGASAEGGPEGRDAVGPDGKALPLEDRLALLDAFGSEYFQNHYATAWGWSQNAPFQWAKETASHLGGTRDPLIVSWPGHIKEPGGLRSQFGHVNDIAPTVFELAGVTPPETVNGVRQTPLEGTSLVYSFDDAKAPSRHHVQYFEMLGSRGIYKDGWWAGSFYRLPWANFGAGPSTPPEAGTWELYNLDEDYSQAHNVADKNPEKLKELVALFDAEAKRNNVYPLAPKRTPQPSAALDKTHFVYYPGLQRLTAANTPRLSGRPYVIAADIVVQPGVQGVILAQGGRSGGFSLFVKDSHVNFEAVSVGQQAGLIVSRQQVTRGKLRVALEFTPDAVAPAASDSFPRRPTPGVAKLSINGEPAGETRISGLYGGGETLDLGADLGTPASTRYATPFPFTGQVEKVTIDLK